MTISEELSYDPYSYEIDEAAQAVWKRLRDDAPLYWNEQYGFHALSRYSDVLRAVLDTATYSSAHATVLELMAAESGPHEMMIWKDPPDHTWHRKVVSRAFTSRSIGALEARITHLCRSLLDALGDRHEFDALEEYGAIVPPTMILELLGFPEGLEGGWRHGIDAMFHSEEGQQGFIGTGGALGSAVWEELPKLIEQRRRQPEDDLLSVLVHTELDEGGQRRRLHDSEIFSFVTMIAIAGTETVARLLGWVTVLLDQHPDQRRELVDDPGLIPNAIEECLRYEAPSPVNGRWLTSEVELYGQVVPAGSKVLLLNGSANRDERHFADPDRFDIRRRIDRHLSFGYGPHFCIGAALARLEGQIALRELLARHPQWEVDHERAVMVRTSTVRGYERVPIRV